jgi:hypothetical protein
MTVNSAKLASLSMLMGCGDAGRLAALEKSLDPHARRAVRGMIHYVTVHAR